MTTAQSTTRVPWNHGRLIGPKPPLKPKHIWAIRTLAAIASELTGREIRRVTVSDDEWRDAKVAAGVPAQMAEMLLGTWRAARRGDFATTDPTLETLLGRRPQTMRDVFAATLKLA